MNKNRQNTNNLKLKEKINFSPIAFLIHKIIYFEEIMKLC